MIDPGSVSRLPCGAGPRLERHHALGAQKSAYRWTSQRRKAGLGRRTCRRALTCSPFAQSSNRTTRLRFRTLAAPGCPCTHAAQPERGWKRHSNEDRGGRDRALQRALSAAQAQSQSRGTVTPQPAVQAAPIPPTSVWRSDPSPAPTVGDRMWHRGAVLQSSGNWAAEGATPVGSGARSMSSLRVRRRKAGGGV